MANDKKVACVTGASGIIGSRIVKGLLQKRYTVRVLSRSNHFDDPRVELFCGGLEDEEVLRLFLRDAHLLFHCAAELNDETKMWEVNVLGTERLLNIAKESGIVYLCHMSSAGVVGKTSLFWVDEKSPCNPQNTYEKSKWSAEQMVSRGIKGCRVVILRPTNVVDGRRPGAFLLPMRGSWWDKFKVLIKGGECAHIVHADDVAAAALYLISSSIESPQCFFVSCDHEPLNTFAGLWSLYRARKVDRSIEDVQPMLHLPLIVPYMIRRLWRGQGNRGNIRYSAEKLLSLGFKFPLDVKGAVDQIISIYEHK